MARMPTSDEFQNFEPFKHLSDSGKSLLQQGLIRQRFARSAAVLSKGQSVSGAYLVLSGRLRIFTITPNGTEATLYFVDPGEACVLAQSCLFHDLNYPAWVQAESDCEVGVIPGPVYRRLFESENAIRQVTVQAMSTLIFRLMAELNDVHSSNQRQRLAQFILAHAAADGSLRTTQQQVAQHLGTTREVIARLMQELVAQGLVHTRRGQISIRDPLGLRRVLSPTHREECSG